MEGPFAIVPEREVRLYENCIPLLSLKAAAGGLTGDEKLVEAQAWVRTNGRAKPGPGMFVAQVVGESMNRRIPSGSYCVFRYPVEGSRQGRVVLVEHRSIFDPEFGGSFTLKVWESDKEEFEDGTWRHQEIRLRPDSTTQGYDPIILRDVAEEDLRVAGELIEVLPAT